MHIKSGHSLTHFYLHFRQYHLDTVQYTLHGLNFLKETYRYLQEQSNPFASRLDYDSKFMDFASTFMPRRQDQLQDELRKCLFR